MRNTLIQLCTKWKSASHLIMSLCLEIVVGDNEFKLLFSNKFVGGFSGLEVAVHYYLFLWKPLGHNNCWGAAKVTRGNL